LQEISTIDEFLKLHDFIDDIQFDQALTSVVKLIVNPAVPATLAPKLIVQLSAISAALALKAKYYMHVTKGKPGSLEHTRKELYLTTSKHLDNIVAALKYSAKL
jgi:hypothetical protein